jgi:hypothetical protein
VESRRFCWERLESWLAWRLGLESRLGRESLGLESGLESLGRRLVAGLCGPWLGLGRLELSLLGLWI